MVSGRRIGSRHDLEDDLPFFLLVPAFSADLAVFLLVSVALAIATDGFRSVGDNDVRGRLEEMGCTTIGGEMMGEEE